jgi:hypothetical protein
VQEWAPSATAGVTVAGGNGQGSAANQLKLPEGLFVDGSGNIYIADLVNQRVQEWAPGATAGVTVAGGNGAGSAANQLANPGGVFVDGVGNIYVDDSANNRIEEWKLAPNGQPLVTADPKSQSVPETTDASFTAGANGRPLPTVQWQQSTDGGSTWSDISGATSGTYTLSSVLASENGFEFRAVFTNAAGSATTNAATLTVIPPPSASVLLPSNGATVSGGTWLDAAASSPVGIASVSFEVSGNGLTNQVVGTGTPTLYGYLTKWNTTSVPNGTYTLQSVATDVDGVSTTGAPITITVNNQPPATAVLIPSGGTSVSGAKALLDASASSAAGIASVTYEVSGNGLTDQVVATGTPTLYGYLAQWNTTAVPNGTYTLSSVATDTVAESTTSAPVSVAVDNPPPSTTMVLPASGAIETSDQALVMDAVASPGVTQVVINLTFAGLGVVSSVTATPTLYGWIGVIPAMLPHGPCDLAFNASVQSVASYSGGVSGTSAPVSFTYHLFGPIADCSP